MVGWMIKRENDSWLSGLSHAQTQRMAFFESKLLWEGRVNRKDVCNQFGVTKNHLTRDLKEYRKNYPENIEYDVSTRAYVIRDTFKPQFTNGTAEEYLSLLRSYSLSNNKEMLLSEMGSIVSCATLPEPNGNVSLNILKTILRAIHNDKCALITYQSFSSERSKPRKIWPHSLVWVDGRWHVRAYDQERAKHIDLVLVRIIKANLDNTPLPENADYDAGWEETIEIKIEPNKILPISHQLIIANEFGMKKQEGKYVWRVVLKKCLVGYFLQKHRLDRDNIDNISNRLMLQDKSISKKYSFNKLD